ncbi:patellin-3-like [Actinidia eriantha]|uniref:patellin-3-like n=1 Tax=Actinidia eriantha TaxID=165200 RepID=UPI00258E4CDC|nr:patellin-3-like [Actinidia eriantha]XP_057468639.1 patellin-3-like [Actinidia eriantha]XP_057468640.1 patellin-3-like [Actinidia eriantha]
MAETADEVLAIVTEKETPLSPPPTEPLNPEPPVQVIESEKPKSIEPHKVPESLVSFKEESNRVADLPDAEKRALEELKQLVQEAVNQQQFTNPSQPPPRPPTAPAATAEPTSEAPPPPPETETLVPESGIAKEIAATHEPKTEITYSLEEISIWGVPLLKDERTDVILLKFLRAREFKVTDAFVMLRNTIRWRKEFNIDALIDEDLGDDLEKVVFMHGFDKEGHPVCYNVYGEFQNKELYQKTFVDEEKRMNFLRWRNQFLERSIRKLDFRPGGVSTIFQVSDLKNSPGPGKRELRIATRQALQLLQDNYPEVVAKQVFINVPWWYLAFYTMISPFLTQRTKSKFVIAGPSRTAEILFKYISPEQVPIQYGGLSVDFCDCNPEFSIDDPATVITVRPATKQTVEIQVNEICTIVWELRVVGWEVSYSAEYVPNAEGEYTVVIQKPKKMSPTDEPVVTNSFKIGELGKIVLAIDNPTSKRKIFVYRFKVKPLCS